MNKPEPRLCRLHQSHPDVRPLLEALKAEGFTIAPVDVSRETWQFVWGEMRHLKRPLHCNTWLKSRDKSQTYVVDLGDHVTLLISGRYRAHNGGWLPDSSIMFPNVRLVAAWTVTPA